MADGSAMKDFSLITLTDAAEIFGMPRPRFLKWVRQHPMDAQGKALYIALGKTKLFTANDLLRIRRVMNGADYQQEAERVHEGWIYFISVGDRIKIGYSRSLNARFRKMLTDVSGEMEILHLEPGTFKTEKIYHRHFAAIRGRGEWFQKTPELLAFIGQRKRIMAGEA